MMWRYIALMIVVTACTKADPETDPKIDLGDFRLGHNVVVTQNARKIGPSRSATADEWEQILEAAIDARFGSYQGTKLYHLGINLDGYALALPGVPVVLAPKSGMVVSINVWDDAAGKKLNEKPRQVSIFEQLDSDTVVGSGITQTREEQMDNLARNMARSVERYLIENAEWFGATGEVLEVVEDVSADPSSQSVPVTPSAVGIETTVLPDGVVPSDAPVADAQGQGPTRPIQRPAN